MRIISESQIGEWARQYPDAAAGLGHWRAVTRKAAWQNLMDVRQDFPHADGVPVASGRTVTVFNIRKNAYRLITAIHFNRQIVYTLRFLTHGEYDKRKWVDDL